MDSCDIEIMRNILRYYYRIRVKYTNYSGLEGVEFLREYDEKVSLHCMRINALCVSKNNHTPIGAIEDVMREMCLRWDNEKDLDFKANLDKAAELGLTPRQYEYFSEWLKKIQSVDPQDRAVMLNQSKFGKNTVVDEAIRALSKRESFERVLYGIPLFEKVCEKQKYPLAERYGGIRNIPLKKIGLTSPQYKAIENYIFIKTEKPAYDEYNVDYTVGDMIDNIKSLRQLSRISTEHLEGVLIKAGITAYAKEDTLS